MPVGAPLRVLLNGGELTPNRSAGRIEDALWDAFLDWARSHGLSNTDAMRRMIRLATGVPEPVPLSGTGSGADRMAAS